MNNKDESAELSWKELYLRTSEDKEILSGASGQVKPFTLTALMGPSGAGKTTLLNTLAGRNDNSLSLDGNIYINGKDRNSINWSKFVSYVPQAFYAYDQETVYETVKFAADIKLSPDRVESKVDEVIETLGLSNVRDTYLNSISGGERVRVSLAIELLSDPSLIFLDEITSGLDSFNALNILKILKDLVKNGRTIITTIHQPSYKMLQYFDKIILMSKGAPVFDGSIDDGIEFFSECGFDLPKNTNPADFFLDVIVLDTTTEERKARSIQNINSIKNEWKFREKPLKFETDDEIHIKELQGSKFNFLNLYFRNLTNVLRKRNYILSKIIQKIFLIVLFALTFFNLRNSQDIFSLRGILTFFFINELFAISGPIFNIFPQEIRVLKRERMSGFYSGYAAYAAKFLSEATIVLAFESVYITSVYWVVGLRADFFIFIEFLFILLLLSIVSISLALTVSSALETTEAAQVVGATLNVFFVLYSGSFNKPSTIPSALRWLIYLSPAQYAFRAILKNQLDDVTLNGKPGNDYIDQLELGGLNIFTCVVINFIFAVCFFTAGSIILHMKTKNNIKKNQIKVSN